MLLMAAGSLQAQETEDVATDEKAQKARAEKVEAASDLRESIHENLETIQEDAQSAKDLRQEDAENQAAEQQLQDDTDDEPGLQT